MKALNDFKVYEVAEEIMNSGDSIDNRSLAMIVTECRDILTEAVKIFDDSNEDAHNRRKLIESVGAAGSIESTLKVLSTAVEGLRARYPNRISQEAVETVYEAEDQCKQHIKTLKQAIVSHLS